MLNRIIPAISVDFQVIYRLEDGAKVPAYKNPAYRKDGEFPIAGYHTVKLDTPVLLKSGTRFSVVLRMEETSGNSEPLAVECKINKYSDKAVCNRGESYFSNDGVNWKDGAEYYKPMNACIKAFTTPAVVPTPTPAPTPTPQ